MEGNQTIVLEKLVNSRGPPWDRRCLVSTLQHPATRNLSQKLWLLPLAFLHFRFLLMVAFFLHFFLFWPVTIYYLLLVLLPIFASFWMQNPSVQPLSVRDWAQVTVCMSDTEHGLGGKLLDFDTAMIKYAAWGFNLSRGEIVRLRSNIDTNNDDTLTAAQRAAITDQDILQLPGAASPLSSSRSGGSGLSLVDILHISVTIRILISYLSYMQTNQIRMHTMDNRVMENYRYLDILQCHDNTVNRV